MKDLKEYKEFNEAFQKLKKLLDKEMPKDVILYTYNDPFEQSVECPVCHEELTNSDDLEYDYCPCCGQHLNWSNVK